MENNQTNIIRLQKIYYVLLGLVFGFVFVKAEIISWWRMQEMFRFQSFHMYGIIGSAIITAMASIYLLKKFDVKTMDGASIHIPAKPFNKGTIIGGLVFGIGWAITGSCPGPLYALIGMGNLTVILTLLSALAGVWIYGWFDDK